MTQSEIELVQASFAKVVPISQQAATLFYDRLFSLNPSLKALFKGDMEDQKMKLIRTLGYVVSRLDSIPTIIQDVEALALRHIDYGVEPAHYDDVGAALIWTLEQGLGSGFDPETKTAWLDTYDLLSNAMKRAAYVT